MNPIQIATPLGLGSILSLALASSPRFLGAQERTPPRAGSEQALQRSTFYWGDLDADGRLDALVISANGASRLLHNAGDGSFADVGARHGLAALDALSAAAWGDYDDDGRLDLLLVRSTGTLQLMRQTQGGVFVDQSLGSGLEHLQEVCATRWLDYDLDQDLDLHLLSLSEECFYQNCGQGFVRVDLGLPGSVQPSVQSRQSAALGLGEPGGRPPADTQAVPAPLTGSGQADQVAAFGFSAPSSGSTSAPGFDPICAQNIVDQASAGCISASSLPTFGLLYPLGPEFNIDPAGNVGIGTISSGPKLEVDLAANEVVRLGQSGVTSELQLTHGRLRSDANRFQILGLSLNNVARPITFGQADGDYDVTIDTNGNVGIGTSVPASRLHIVGNLLVDGAATYSGDLTALRLASTATSGAPLTVSSTTKVANLNADLLDGIDSAAFSQFGTLVNTNEIADGAVTSAKLANNLDLSGDLSVDTNTLFVDAAANRVGIGTTVPSHKLDVAGDVEVGDDLFVLDTLTVTDSITAEAGKVLITNTTAGAGYLSVSGPSGSENVRLSHTTANSDHGALSVIDATGTAQAGMYVDPAGLGIVWGDIKNFVAENPLDPSTHIWYASLEGPEAAAYVRGSAQLIEGQATIELPEHFQSIASNEGMTVLLSACSPLSRGLAAVEKSLQGIVVRELHNGRGSYTFDWEVKAIRQGFENYQVLRPLESAAIAQPAAKLPEQEADH